MRGQCPTVEIRGDDSFSDTTCVVAAGGNGATVHGFRSTVRDWWAETTGRPGELAEAVPAHTLGDKTETACQRGDLLERRRRLMTDRAAFCAKPMVLGDRVPLRVAAG